MCVDSAPIPKILDVTRLPAALWTCAPDGTLTWYNAEAVALWGSAPALPSSTCRWCGARLLDPDGIEVDPSVLGDAARADTDRRAREHLLETPDGVRHPVLIHSQAVHDASGALEGVVHVAMDVTAIHARTRKDLAITERASRHLAAIVESSDDAIIGKNLDSIVTSWNEAAERLFGYTAEEMIGRPITLLIPPHMHDEEPRIIGRIRAGDRIEHYETVRLHKDGHPIEISLTVSPIKDRAGKIIGASKIVRDISQRRRQERLLADTREQLERAKEELERRVQERTASLADAISQMEEFSYTVSHDLRAPLRAMQVYSTALLEDFSDLLANAPDAIHYLERIAANATRLDRMILDVLTFSRLARSEMSMERVDLDDLVREIISHYPSMQPPAAEIQVDRLDPVVGHVPSLTQAVSNLLTNAVKFAKPGAVPRVRVWTERRGAKVRLSVQDDGVGVDPAVQHRLFRMFERVHADGEVDGSGVGLAIVKKAVERMNGTLGMDSDGVHGSTFWAELPGGAA